jgi:hypothetical protein
MNDVRVVGDQHQRHRGEEGVVLEADEAGRRSFARAEIARGEQRDRRRGAEQQTGKNADSASRRR